VIEQHLRPKWGTVQLTDIKPLAVQEWLKQIDLSRKTRQNIKAVFHRMVELAMLWELMPSQRNPLSLVEIKGGSSRPRRKKMILTPEQFRQIREKLDLHPGKRVQAIQYGDRVELVPVRPMGSMRGFLAAIDTTVDRDEDRL